MYQILYAGAQSTAGGALSYFAGTTDCTNTTPENCKLFQYPAKVSATGSVSGGTITITVPLATGFGVPVHGTTLYNATAFTFGRDDATADIYADVDSTHSFDYPLGTVAQTDCGAPTAVRMLGFGARPTRGGVILRWRTASENAVLGFNVWRRGTRGESRVNRSLVAARGTVAGASYRLIDRAARAGRSYIYRLQIVSRDGSRSWYGSARVRVTG